MIYLMNYLQTFVLENENVFLMLKMLHNFDIMSIMYRTGGMYAQN